MKKNLHFRRIPDYIEQELQNTKSQRVIIAAIINTSMTDISQGSYSHLNIRLQEGELVIPDVVYPDNMSGIYARRNRDGVVHVLKDLPKVTRTFSFDSPNFGDPAKGYHTTYIDRSVYQRRFDPPRDWEIALQALSQDEKTVCIKATINTTLDRQDTDFNKDLFFAINLLQEQCRDCHVFDYDITKEELARIMIVGWEIFPPGKLDKTLSIITKRLRNSSPERQREIQRRTNVLDRFNPTEYIVGRGMNSHYFGAKFGDNIVAFENMDYGNALYILFDNWQEISQMSRIEILKRHEKDFIRIIHKKGWERVLRRHIIQLKSFI